MVIVKTGGLSELQKEIQNKKLICFGAGNHFDTIMNLYRFYQLEEQVEYILDNNSALSGQKKHYKGKEIDILTVANLKKTKDIHNIVILITCHIYSMEIVSQLDSDSDFDGVSVYIGSFLSEERNKIFDYKIISGQKTKIPNVIHYCWFGKSEMPKENREYMKSWAKYCPDYEIKRWDESNFDVTQNKYMAQAYANKKWAFVSDYARVKILHDYGGIYLDCDVELCKTLDDLLTADFYCGFEDKMHINLGLGFGSVAGHPYLSALLKLYDELQFINSDGNLNLTPCPAYQTEVIKQFGIKDKNSYQEVSGIRVYPTEVFAPVSPWGIGEKTEKSYSVHHYAASWQTTEFVDAVNKMYEEYCQRTMK